MQSNSEQLLSIYKRAKLDRRVHTQSEFAQMLGFSSRIHLFGRLIKGEHGGVSDELLDRAKEIFESHDSENVTFNEEGRYLVQRRNKKLEDKNSVTFYEVGAKAGPVGDILPVKKSEGVLHISDLFRGSQFAIRVSGNSMMPNYPPGAIIGIREVEDKQITPGSVYVIEKGNELWIKRLFYKDDSQDSGYFQCISDNAMKFENGGREGKLFYPPFFVEVDKVRRLFKVTGIYKANELIVIK